MDGSREVSPAACWLEPKSKSACLGFYMFLNFLHTIKLLKPDNHKGGMDRTNIRLIL